jgi:hypothetical protein
MLHSARTDLTPERRIYARPLEAVSHWPRSSNGNIGLADAIKHINATMLLPPLLLSGIAKPRERICWTTESR